MGLFGQGNLGNEMTLQAILHNLHQYYPEAEVNCVCTGPEAVRTIHNIPAVQMEGGKPIKQKGFHKSFVVRLIRKLFIRIPTELCRWVEAYRHLKGTDKLIIPGTQFLSDNLCGPFGWPYLTFKWTAMAKIRRCKILFVSVGVGPLRHPLSRFFVKSSLWFADYRSYRDDLSKKYVHSIGFIHTGDKIYPDLAFSLPIQSMIKDNHNSYCKGTPVISIGVKDYQGQYGTQPAKDRPEDIYHLYINKVADFVAWLLKHNYTVRLVIGDATYDPQVQRDLRKLLNEREIKYDDLQVIDEPIMSVEALVSQLAESDIVVSPRFHNIVLGFMLNKPVIALSYHEKFSAVMEEPDFAEYNLHIDHWDVNIIIEKLIKLESNSDKIKLCLMRKAEEKRRALDEQYNIIFT